MNNKHANTERQVIDLIRHRWSPRAFSSKAISQESLETVLEAASWAFSGGNAQPWKYVYAHQENKESFAKLLDCLLPGNQPWAKHAPVLMVAIMQKKTESGQPNRTAMHDVGAANATLALQGESMGIYSHVMAGFDQDKTTATLNLNAEDQAPVVFIAMGYLDTHEKLDEPYKSRELLPRSRKPVKEFSSELV